MFLVEDNNITLTKGDSGSFFVKLINGDGTEYVPYVTDKITFSVKKKKESFCPVVIEKKGLEIILNAADTETIPSGEYVYDIVLERSTGERYTAVEGKFLVRKAVHEFE